MSASPLVQRPIDALHVARPATSPLKRQASAVPSSNGTPRHIRTAGHEPHLPTTLDMAEQINEEEKKKYVKGTADVLLTSLPSEGSLKD